MALNRASLIYLLSPYCSKLYQDGNQKNPSTDMFCCNKTKMILKNNYSKALPYDWNVELRSRYLEVSRCSLRSGSSHC